MKFNCPDCGQALETQTMYSGQTVQCPRCGAGVVIPSSTSSGSGASSSALDPVSTEARGTSASGDSTIANILTSEPARKYEVGNVVAQGGMGAILNAKDVNLRRNVAMKVMLEKRGGKEEQVLRFVEEAQVTGQLEHPGIVPLYELGLDERDNVFYTMKFVKGRTLSDILEKIADGDRETIGDYPLAHLLTIFQKVCDAIAFAHSKSVIHRDLKPENVMVGDYGEVLVMDWGLAKVLPRRTKSLGSRVPSLGSKNQKFQVSLAGLGQAGLPVRRSLGEGGSPQPSPRIDSVRSNETGEILKTMDGAIMGTPGFMSPEQALGKTDEIDERTDIYALGAILYNILTLRVPITGTSLAEIIDKVSTGDIRHPSEFNSTTKTRNRQVDIEQMSFARARPKGERIIDLKHLPGEHVPDSLSAVTMKALSVEPGGRYQSVKELQKEIEAYQGGFATSAEEAGVWKQIRLFVRRNKTLSISVLVVLAVVSAGGVISATQWLRAQKALIAFKSEQTARAKDRKESAPAIVRSARVIAEQGDYSAANSLLQTAIEYDPAIWEAYFLRVLLMIRGSNYVETMKLCEEMARVIPGNSRSGRLGVICRELSIKGMSDALSMELSNILLEHGLPTLAAEFAKSPNEKLELYRQKITRNCPFVSKHKLSFDAEGRLNLDLVGISGLRDLSPFAGIPVKSLSLYNASIVDLSPLKSMTLVSLNLSSTPVSDISPLKGMALTNLDLWNSRKIEDITPLKGMPLISLGINQTKVKDISPLKGMQLSRLDIGMTGVMDLSALKGMPLKGLDIYETKVRDLSPLKGMPLTYLGLGKSQVNDLRSLEGVPLERLRMPNTEISDLAPLKNMPLKLLQINNTRVTDLRPLKGMQLEEFYFTPGNIKNGIEIIREMKSITRIGIEYRQNSILTPAEFWKKYDAGEFR